MINPWLERKPEIERLYGQGFSQADLATLYKVSQPAMVNVMRKLGIAATHKPRKQETVLRAHFISLAGGLFTRQGWWTPERPSFTGEKRINRCSDD